MAFGQIDPARLRGDALTRWYLRSPAEIEEEKRQQAEQAYNAYFAQGETPPDPRLAADGADVAPADRTPSGSKSAPIAGEATPAAQITHRS